MQNGMMITDCLTYQWSGTQEEETNDKQVKKATYQIMAAVVIKYIIKVRHMK
uniref:Uncharacterized protein n=1 Tax=Arion vulgaris TaxID=1028688 RepID=A0A0B6YTT3_9EUPU